MLLFSSAGEKPEEGVVMGSPALWCGLMMMLFEPWFLEVVNCACSLAWNSFIGTTY